MLSIICLILLIGAYIASVGWNMVRQEVNLLEGLDYDFSVWGMWFYGPYVVLRDFFGDVTTFLYHGTMLVCSEDFRASHIEEFYKQNEVDTDEQSKAP